MNNQLWINNDDDIQERIQDNDPIDTIGQEVQEPGIIQNAGFGRATPFPAQGLEQQPAHPRIVPRANINRSHRFIVAALVLLIAISYPLLRTFLSNPEKPVLHNEQNHTIINGNHTELPLQNNLTIHNINITFVAVILERPAAKKTHPAIQWIVGVRDKVSEKIADTREAARSWKNETIAKLKAPANNGNGKQGFLRKVFPKLSKKLYQS